MSRLSLVGACGLSRCGTWAWLPCGMWHLLRPGIEPVSPAKDLWELSLFMLLLPRLWMMVSRWHPHPGMSSLSGYVELDLVNEKGKDWNETCPLRQGQDWGENTHLMKRTVLSADYKSKATLKIQPSGRISQRRAQRKPPVFPNNPCSCMSLFHAHYLEHPSYLCLLSRFILHNQVIKSPPLQSQPLRFYRI